MTMLPASVLAIAAIAALLIAMGLALGPIDRRNFSLRWLLVAAGLVVLNDALLTNFYGLLPDLIPGSGWNWQGKLLAFASTLLIAAHPAIGWTRSGLTFRQRQGSLAGATTVALLYCGFFLLLASIFPNEAPGKEDVAFQLTMPGFEEEAFYRGTLLLALNEAFRGRLRAFGIDWGWGALLSCLAFGLAHAFGYSASAGFSFDAMTMAATSVPSLLAVWLRERTGSLLFPVILHNFGNAIMMIL